MHVPGVSASPLMHLEHLKSRAVRVQIAQVEGVAMTKARTVEQCAVVVERTCAPNDFIASVAIDISNRHIVVAVAVHRAAASATGGPATREVLAGALAIGIEGGHGVAVLGLMRAEPTLMEQLPVEVNRPNEGEGIVSTTEDAAGRFVWAVKLGNASEETLTTVAVACIVGSSVAVIPVECACGFSTIAGIAVWIVEDGVYSLARQSVEYGEVLLSASNLSVAIAMDGSIAGVLDNVFRSHLVHIVVLAVLGARSSLTHHLSKTVAVEVVDHELGIVCTSTYIRPQINAPKSFAAELVAVDEDIVSDTTLRVVLGVGWVPFDEDLVFAVTVDIAYRAVVRVVVTSVGSLGRSIQHQLQVTLCPGLDSSSSINRMAAHEGDNLIAAGLLSCCIGVVRGIEILCQALTVAQQLKTCVFCIVAQRTPTDEHP